MQDGKVTGTVHLIEETKSYGQKGFRKRQVVLVQDADGAYPNYIPIDFTRDSCDEVDVLNVGDEVEISFILSGRKWQKDADSDVKYFMNAEATGFNQLVVAEPKEAVALDGAMDQAVVSDDGPADIEGDDVPF